MSEITKIEAGTAVAEHREPDPMVAMIERVVMSPNADLDKLERMLALKERLDANNARVAFAGALAAARAEIPPIMKDATVDFTSAKGRTHYKHETLAGIAKVIDPILSQHGLSYRWRTDQGQSGVRVTCIITHAAGHSEETSLVGPPDASGSKNGYQAIGSATTYLQRYTLKAALGLSAEVDDDGQSAAPRPSQQSRDENRATEARTTEAQIEAETLIVALKAATCEAELQALWDDEVDTRKRVHAADSAQYDRVKAAAAQRKQALRDAAQRSISGQIIDDEIPY